MGARSHAGANADITFVGPAGVVYFRFDVPDLGSVLLFQTHTPLTPMLLQTQFRYYADAHIPRLLVSYIVGNWVSQWANDLMVYVELCASAFTCLRSCFGDVAACAGAGGASSWNCCHCAVCACAWGIVPVHRPHVTVPFPPPPCCSWENKIFMRKPLLVKVRAVYPGGACVFTRLCLRTAASLAPLPLPVA
jgi:hypothetical protein